MIEVTEATFEQEVLKSDMPVLVDFSAVWCGPCRGLTPVLERLADEYTERLRVVKVDIDNSNAIASRYNIRAVPTLVLFKGGDVVDTMIGANPQPKISGWLMSRL